MSFEMSFIRKVCIWKIFKCKMTHRRRLRNVNMLKDSIRFTWRFYSSALDYFSFLWKRTNIFCCQWIFFFSPESKVSKESLQMHALWIDGWRRKVAFRNNILWTKKMWDEIKWKSMLKCLIIFVPPTDLAICLEQTHSINIRKFIQLEQEQKEKFLAERTQIPIGDQIDSSRESRWIFTGALYVSQFWFLLGHSSDESEKALTSNRPNRTVWRQWKKKFLFVVIESTKNKKKVFCFDLQGKRKEALDCHLCSFSKQGCWYSLCGKNDRKIGKKEVKLRR